MTHFLPNTLLKQHKVSKCNLLQYNVCTQRGSGLMIYCIYNVIPIWIPCLRFMITNIKETKCQLNATIANET